MGPVFCKSQPNFSLIYCCICAAAFMCPMSVGCHVPGPISLCCSIPVVSKLCNRRRSVRPSHLYSTWHV